MDVALAVLEGVAAGGVRASASILDRAPGTVSKQLAVLRRAYLVDGEGRPVVPDLFEAVVDAWNPARVPLGGRPTVDDAMGWVLADTAAASAWAAPVVVTADSPPDFYLPDSASLRRARALLGEAEFGRHGCTVAEAPAPFVCRRMYERGVGFPAPSHIVAASDLAADPARARGILEAWSSNLPPEVHRVW